MRRFWYMHPEIERGFSRGLKPRHICAQRSVEMRQWQNAAHSSRASSGRSWNGAPSKPQAVLLGIAAFCGLILGAGGGAEAALCMRGGAIAALPARAHQSEKGSGSVQSSLDFETYRTRIEPNFLKQRQGGMHCYDCHSVLVTRLRLEPLSPGNSSWTTEQSRRTFEVVSQLITPSDPLKSRLLLHPLAQEGDGDPSHTGGKFWASQSDPEWKMLADWIRHSGEAQPATQTASHSAATDALDFQFFRTKVEPIFLKQRLGTPAATGVTLSQVGRFIWRRCHPEARIGPTNNRSAISRAHCNRLFLWNRLPADS